MFRFCLSLYALLIHAIVRVLPLPESSLEENGFHRYAKSEGEFEGMKYTERGGAKQLDCLSPLKHLPLLNGALIFRLFEDAAGTRDVHACDIV
uniref:Secreted protein n=1 Tax=Physcomitrium patens TaxID=3218 RepID=A0A2K1IQB7_PHYPA|nr:hypothetical protein PHYPA_025569 [Physcomitrium patens]